MIQGAPGISCSLATFLLLPVPRRQQLSNTNRDSFCLDHASPGLSIQGSEDSEGCGLNTNR